MDDEALAARIRAAFAAVDPPTSLSLPARPARRRYSLMAVVAVSSVAIVAVGALVAVSIWLSSPCTYGTGCAGSPPTLAPGALTRDQAIAAAIAQAPPAMGNPTVAWATAGQNPFDPSSGSLVWLVRLDGTGELPTCAPGYLDRVPSPRDAPCLEDHQGKEPYGLVAVLDPLTGKLMGWSH
jgi:hypothetical protein